MPKLDQRSAWQQHIREAELQRAETPAPRRFLVQTAQASSRQEQDSSRQEKPISASEPARTRRALLMPSQLADRHDGNIQGYAYGDADRPAATPLARGENLAGVGFGDAAVEAPASQALQAQDDAADDPVVADVHRVTNREDDQSLPGDQASGPPAKPDLPSEAREIAIETIEVAVYSTEALDANIERIRSLDDFNTDPAISIPSPDSFTIQSSSSAHVRQRPRDDAPSWLKNAVAASLIDDRPVIAVVIDDLGMNRTGTKALNDLPGPLTLAFLPYAGNIEAQTEAARLAGHELMVHLPMEPFGPARPGPGALVTSLDHDEFVERLEKNLNRIKGYAGVNNHMGSRLTSDRGRMDLVMRELRDRDVLFLDSKTSPRSVASEMASRNGVPNTIRDIFLDHVIDIEEIRHQMVLIERIARRTGSAVAIGHPHAATIEALRGWLPGLAARGFALAPISAVVARRACHNGLLIAAETCGHYLQAQKPDAPSITAGGG